MKVTILPYGAAVNESESLAIERSKTHLQNVGAGRQTRGVTFHTLHQWKDVVGFDQLPVLSPQTRSPDSEFAKDTYVETPLDASLLTAIRRSEMRTPSLSVALFADLRDTQGRRAEASLHDISPTKYRDRTNRQGVIHGNEHARR